jgi:hypothetical protein
VGAHYSIPPIPHYAGFFVWSLRLVSRQRLLLFREALICLSYSGLLNEEGRRKNEERARVPRILHFSFYLLPLKWSSRQVTLLRLPVISRVLCF